MRVRFIVGAGSAVPDLRLLPATAALRLGAFAVGSAILRLGFAPKVASLGSSEHSLLGEGELTLELVLVPSTGCV